MAVQNKVRIQEVATLAGVSVGSASRVLNRVANVSPAIKERVLHAVATLGYEPSHTARALRSKSSMTLGCLFSDVTNPLYARSFRALEDSFREHGYMLLLANGLNDVYREMDMLRTFQARGLDAVVYAPDDEYHPELIKLLGSLSMPIVLYDRDAPVKADRVLFEHSDGKRAVCSRLIAVGHTRIALALWDSNSRPVRQRIEGYRSAFVERGLAVPVDLILRQPTATSSVYDDLLGLLEGPHPPTGLIAQGTHMLVTALQAIARSGRRIPEDFSVVSIGDSDFSQSNLPAITALRVNVEDIAQSVRALVLARLNGPGGEESIHLRIPYEVVDRDSWGPLA